MYNRFSLFLANYTWFQQEINILEGILQDTYFRWSTTVYLDLDLDKERKTFTLAYSWYGVSI